MMRSASEKEQRSTWREEECAEGSCELVMVVWGRSWRQTSGGQPEREELACDGSCPGLILSVCAGWQEGCKGRLSPLLSHTHPHSMVHTLNQQIDLDNPSGPCVLPYAQPTLPLLTFLDLSLHTKSLSMQSHPHTHTHSLPPCSPYQTSAAPPAGSWPGEEQESPGSKFTWRLPVHALTRFPLPSIPALS